MHTIANSSNRGGDTKAKQLRSDSHHYWEENNATITPAASPNPFTPLPAIQAVHGSHSEHPRQRSSASDHSGSTKNSGALHRLTAPLPTTLCREDQCYLVTEETPTSPWNKGHVLLPRRYQRGLRSAEGCVSPTGKQRKTSFYQPANEASLLIIITFLKGRVYSHKCLGGEKSTKYNE